MSVDGEDYLVGVHLDAIHVPSLAVNREGGRAFRIGCATEVVGIMAVDCLIGNVIVVEALQYVYFAAVGPWVFVIVVRQKPYSGPCSLGAVKPRFNLELTRLELFLSLVQIPPVRYGDGSEVVSGLTMPRSVSIPLAT